MPVEGFIIDRLGNRGITLRSSNRTITDRVKFLYFQPISNEVNANYDEASVRGRSEPHPFYIDGSPDNYQFNIRFESSVDEADGGSAKKVEDAYLFVKSFQYPDYGDPPQGPVRPPRHCIITIGTWFRKRGIIKNFSAQWGNTYDPEGFPHRVDISFILRAFNPQALGWRDIVRNFNNDPSTPST